MFNRSALRRPNSFLIQYALPKETLLETEVSVIKDRSQAYRVANLLIITDYFPQARTNSVDLMSAIRDVLER